MLKRKIEDIIEQSWKGPFTKELLQEISTERETARNERNGSLYVELFDAEERVLSVMNPLRKMNSILLDLFYREDPETNDG